MVNVSEYVSDKFGSKKSKSKENHLQKRDREDTASDATDRNPTPLVTGNRNGLGVHNREGLTTEPLLNVNSNVVLSSDDSIGMINSDIVTTNVSSRLKETSDTDGNTPRYLRADSNRQPKPLSRHGTVDSGVYSQRSSSRASSMYGNKCTYSNEGEDVFHDDDRENRNTLRTGAISH